MFPWLFILSDHSLCSVRVCRVGRSVIHRWTKSKPPSRYDEMNVYTYKNQPRKPLYFPPLVSKSKCRPDCDLWLGQLWTSPFLALRKIRRILVSCLSPPRVSKTGFSQHVHLNLLAQLIQPEERLNFWRNCKEARARLYRSSVDYVEESGIYCR